MKTLTMRKIAMAVAGAAAIGVAVPAVAAPTFTIDLSAIFGGAPDQYTGDFFSGTSTELLNTVGNTHNGSGWMQISGLSQNAVTVIPFGTNAFAPLDLYVTFTLTDVLTSGAMNAAGSTYNVTSLDFILWADPSKDNTFVNASANPAVAASVTDAGADDIVLGFGSLISGTAGLTDLGGAFLNSVNSFAVCSGLNSASLGAVAVDATGICADDTGSRFFVEPDPFYDLAFTEFNNTAQGFEIDAATGALAINSASGGVDFNRVPEPASLALIGLGLLGVVASRRAGKKG